MLKLKKNFSKCKHVFFYYNNSVDIFKINHYVEMVTLNMKG